MNDHSKDSQTRYLKETAIVLAREGFQTDRTHTDGLRVQLDGVPLCEVTDNGAVLPTAMRISTNRNGSMPKTRCWRISTALCWLEFRANTESTSSHGIGPMGTQEYVMGTISWRTMQEPNRTLLSAPG